MPKPAQRNRSHVTRASEVCARSKRPPHPLPCLLPATAPKPAPRKRNRSHATRAPKSTLKAKYRPILFLAFYLRRPQSPPRVSRTAPSLEYASIIDTLTRAAEPQSRHPGSGGLRWEQQTAPSSSLPHPRRPQTPPRVSGTAATQPARRSQRSRQNTDPSSSLPYPRQPQSPPRVSRTQPPSSAHRRQCPEQKTAPSSSLPHPRRPQSPPRVSRTAPSLKYASIIDALTRAAEPQPRNPRAEVNAQGKIPTHPLPCLTRDGPKARPA